MSFPKTSFSGAGKASNTSAPAPAGVSPAGAGSSFTQLALARGAAARSYAAAIAAGHVTAPYSFTGRDFGPAAGTVRAAAIPGNDAGLPAAAHPAGSRSGYSIPSGFSPAAVAQPTIPHGSSNPVGSTPSPSPTQRDAASLSAREMIAMLSWRPAADAPAETPGHRPDHSPSAAPPAGPTAGSYADRPRERLICTHSARFEGWLCCQGVVPPGARPEIRPGFPGVSTGWGISRGDREGAPRRPGRMIDGPVDPTTPGAGEPVSRGFSARLKGTPWSSDWLFAPPPAPISPVANLPAAPPPSPVFATPPPASPVAPVLPSLSSSWEPAPTLVFTGAPLGLTVPPPSPSSSASSASPASRSASPFSAFASPTSTVPTSPTSSFASFASDVSTLNVSFPPSPIFSHSSESTLLSTSSSSEESDGAGFPVPDVPLLEETAGTEGGVTWDVGAGVGASPVLTGSGAEEWDSWTEGMDDTWSEGMDDTGAEGDDEAEGKEGEQEGEEEEEEEEDEDEEEDETDDEGSDDDGDDSDDAAAPAADFDTDDEDEDLYSVPPVYARDRVPTPHPSPDPFHPADSDSSTGRFTPVDDGAVIYSSSSRSATSSTSDPGVLERARELYAPPRPFLRTYTPCSTDAGSGTLSDSEGEPSSFSAQEPPPFVRSYLAPGELSEDEEEGGVLLPPGWDTEGDAGGEDGEDEEREILREWVRGRPGYRGR